MALDQLHELYVEQLKDVYSAEKQITQALPKMANAADSADLKKAFESHLEQTRQQMDRLEQIFQKLGEKPGGKTCKGMQGLIEEGEEMIKEGDKGMVRDAGLIAAAQKVEHYEIATYGTLRTFADMMDHNDHVKLLQATLDEESQTDEKLTKLAMKINPKAKEMD